MGFSKTLLTVIPAAVEPSKRSAFCIPNALNTGQSVGAFVVLADVEDTMTISPVVGFAPIPDHLLLMASV